MIDDLRKDMAVSWRRLYRASLYISQFGLYIGFSYSNELNISICYLVLPLL